MTRHQMAPPPRHLVHLLLSSCALCGAGATDIAKALAPVGIEPGHQQLGGLRQLIDFLRDGDSRFVRLSPIGRTAERQKTVASLGGISKVAAALESKDQRTRLYAAEVVSLLSTNDPKNRLQLGKAGVVIPLGRMVKEGILSRDALVSKCTERAAQAIWSLAFAGGEDSEASGENQKQFDSGKLVPALADLVITSDSSIRAKMWATAALGNLVADYESVPKPITENRRNALVKHPRLLDTLMKMANSGPVDPSAPARHWPSRASDTDRVPRSMLAWGATHALKNIALTKTGWYPLKKRGIVKAMCRLKTSPDQIEKEQAEATLQNVGGSCDEL
eukprot:TRINITY_DN12438_c0_g1_i2.p2 TRINITY_DN12438_c0_g1~~TRINITY_DN12438_c0_g1_i2.p2  ORF type:complete len:333 (+),score=59.09 TRINITY_DN12438_c0_g1_i2:1848-2846(+)